MENCSLIAWGISMGLNKFVFSIIWMWSLFIRQRLSWHAAPTKTHASKSQKESHWIESRVTISPMDSCTPWSDILFPRTRSCATYAPNKMIKWRNVTCRVTFWYPKFWYLTKLVFLKNYFTSLGYERFTACPRMCFSLIMNIMRENHPRSWMILINDDKIPPLQGNSHDLSRKRIPEISSKCKKIFRFI